MTAPNLVWNTVYGLKSHRQISVALLDLAAECARRAIEPNPGEVAGLDKLIRLMSVGQAAELVVKSTLAGMDPTLLAEKANTATLYALAGNARRLQGKVTTVGAVEAVRRLNECRPPASPNVVEPKHLFEIRNDAIHMGLAPSDVDLEEALNELVTLVDSVFKIRAALFQSDDLRTFWSAWSAKHIQIVEARQRARYERLQTNFQGLITQAQASYARLIAGLSPDERNRLIAELVTRAPEVDNEQTLRSHKCPACHNSLWVVYDVEREVYLDDSDAPNSFGLRAKVRAYVHSAMCPVCDLSLDQTNVVLTDIPYMLDLGEDDVTADEHDGWYDARDAEEGDRWADYSPSPDDFDDACDGSP